MIYITLHCDVYNLILLTACSPGSCRKECSGRRRKVRDTLMDFRKKKKSAFKDLYCLFQGFVWFISRICLVYSKDLSGLFAGSAKYLTLGSPGIFEHVLKALPEEWLGC